MIYRLLFTLVLRHIPPERTHVLAARATHAIGTIPQLRRLIGRLLAPRDEALQVRALGVTFPSPLGAAGGTDKDALWFEELGALGFGFVEVGTVTARPQPGNPKPRVHRLAADRALINSMGFPNAGAAATAQRLRRRGQTIVGVNVGRSKAAEDATADYRESIRALAPLADFVVLNVSSPNTPGLRAMQAVDQLEALVTAVQHETSVPLLVKISPDLADADIDAIADLALRLELDGIVAVNTTTSREGLTAPPPDAPGGLSGAPLKRRAVEVLRRLYAQTRGELLVVSVGGIETADDAWERILAGATLVQAYTGFVYGGPLWPSRINRELAARVRKHGAGSIQELVGAASRAHQTRPVTAA